MGYNTYFELYITSPKDVIAKQLEELNAEIEKMNVFEEGSLEDGLYTYGHWYDYDLDMLKLSAKYPDYIFELHGNGEETEDLWIHYFVGGRSQYCHAKITYDSFSANCLKPPPPDFDFNRNYEYG